MPRSEKRARLLLERGRAVVVRRYPFTIRLRDRVGGDPGSKTTGIAHVADPDGNKPAKALGFPRGYCVRQKTVRGFQTGDIVRADIVKGKKTGTYIGRVAIRASGSFNVQTLTRVVQGINARHCTLVHRSDGCSYRGPASSPTDKSGGIWRGKIR